MSSSKSNKWTGGSKLPNQGEKPKRGGYKHHNPRQTGLTERAVQFLRDHPNEVWRTTDIERQIGARHGTIASALLQYKNNHPDEISDLTKVGRGVWVANGTTPKPEPKLTWEKKPEPTWEKKAERITTDIVGMSMNGNWMVQLHGELYELVPLS